MGSGLKMSWFAKRKNSKPSLMSLIKPLLKCLATKLFAMYPSSSFSLYKSQILLFRKSKRRQGYKQQTQLKHFFESSIRYLCDTGILLFCLNIGKNLFIYGT